MFILGISKEHESLPIAEVRGILQGERKNYEITREGPLLFIETETIDTVLERASMVRFGAKVINIIDSIDDFSLDLNGKTFSIRYMDYSGKSHDRSKIERIAGAKVKGKVNLENPEVSIGLIKLDKIYVTEFLQRKDPEFKKRINQVRPFKTNLALQPKMARMLVNLSRVKKGDTIVDPFCGGGSVLIEALLMGINAVGVDSSEKMFTGCKKNLEHYGLNAAVFKDDFSTIENMGKFDAIVTDPPYGRGSTTNKENVKMLYKRAFNVFLNAKKSDGFISIILPSEEYVKLANEYFNVLEVNSMKVHRSLTRYFTVLY